MSDSRPMTPPPTPPLPLILPHDLPSAAYALAPLSDLHLSHLLIAIPEPNWLTHHKASQASGDVGFGAETVSNDRLAHDELEDISAHEAERLRAAYQIEDHLDATTGRLWLFASGKPLEKIVEEMEEAVADMLVGDAAYVARLWVRPKAGQGYLWMPGGADLVKFERGSNGKLLWRPIEVVLSQALESGHRVRSLLHHLHLKALLPELPNLVPADPIVWLVNPVEYAHAQLREQSSWGWSEHSISIASCGVYPTTESEAVVDLLAWLQDLLDRRITRVLSLPGGCFSFDLLPAFAVPDPSRSLTYPTLKPFSFPMLADEADGRRPHLALNHADTVRGSPHVPPQSPPPTAYSPAPSSPTGVEPLSPSTDTGTAQPSLVSSAFLLCPPPDADKLPHFACRACGEHSFTLAVSMRLAEEEQRRNEWGEPSDEVHDAGGVEGGLVNLCTQPADGEEGDKGSGTGNANENGFASEDAYRVIGLGPKGRAANEAMDADDAFWRV